MIGPYHRRPVHLEDWNPALVEAAARLCLLIQAEAPALRVEHVGSTAVEGLGGKGIIDLMVTAAPDGFERVKQHLSELGFQRQTCSDPFPEDRPMRVGSMEHGARTFGVHVHLIPDDRDEVGHLLRFRDLLRADPELRALYLEDKERILAAGHTDGVDYSERKGAFILRALQAG